MITIDVHLLRKINWRELRWRWYEAVVMIGEGFVTLLTLGFYRPEWQINLLAKKIGWSNDHN